MKIKLLIIIILNITLANDINSKFQFNQSTIQAFYFIVNANIYGEPLEEGTDWIIAYHNDLCIGARKWAGPYTDIPIMGDDGSDYSKGYIKSGELPVFKIYDQSEDILYNANLSEQIPYPKGMVGMITIESLNVPLESLEITQHPLLNNKLYDNNDYQVFNGYQYGKPKRFSYITSLPYDLNQYKKIVLNKKYFQEFVGLSLITGLLIYFDEDLIKKSRFMYDTFNISYTDNMETIAEPFGQPIRVPEDFGSALYFIGDGWTQIGISMSYYCFGKINNNNRALQTSNQILQGLVSAGFLTQVIKHITGRTSPFKSIDWDSHSTNEWNAGNIDVNDRWDFFPNQIEYHKYVSSYDAFPSGHLAGFMSTLTIITENYPEYPIIKPIGYTLMTLLSIQMMNNGVHWASDYPLSIAMGYYLGKIAVNSGKKNIESSQINYRIEPYTNFETIGLNLTYYFK